MVGEDRGYFVAVAVARPARGGGERQFIAAARPAREWPGTSLMRRSLVDCGRSFWGRLLWGRSRSGADADGECEVVGGGHACVLQVALCRRSCLRHPGHSPVLFRF